MQNNQLHYVLDQITSTFNTKQYYKTLYLLAKLLSANLSVCKSISYESMQNEKQCLLLLIRLHSELQNNKALQEGWRGCICTCIATCLNNITADTYIPQNINSIKRGLTLQKLAISYFYFGMRILNNCSCEVTHDNNNYYNFDLCKLELNYVITLSADTCAPAIEEINAIYNRILHRLDTLLKLDPANEEFRLIQVYVLEFKGDVAQAKCASKQLIQSANSTIINNLSTVYTKQIYKNTKHLVTLYNI